MIRLSVMYPATTGSTFNWNCYLGPHFELAHRLDARGLIRFEIGKGIGSFPPGTSVPYHAIGHLFFATLADLQNALAPTAGQFVEDERKYASAPSIVQISEVVG